MQKPIQIHIHVQTQIHKYIFIWHNLVTANTPSLPVCSSYVLQIQIQIHIPTQIHIKIHIYRYSLIWHCLATANTALSSRVVVCFAFPAFRKLAVGLFYSFHNLLVVYLSSNWGGQPWTISKHALLGNHHLITVWGGKSETNVGFWEAGKPAFWMFAPL